MESLQDFSARLVQETGLSVHFESGFPEVILPNLVQSLMQKGASNLQVHQTQKENMMMIGGKKKQRGIHE